ncbi:MAG: hypothetical protein Kow00114_22640 [Kiloniellaceae bacterium]
MVAPTMPRRRSLLRPQRARIARLAASILAGLGLLGHGLAMLLVSLLVQGPAGAPAAAGAFPAWVEICAADGEARLVATGIGAAPLGTPRPADSAPEQDPDHGPAHGPTHGQDHLKLCAVCTAFAQSGLADLPAPLVLAGRHDGADASLPLQHLSRTGREGLAALSRGPPAA